IHDAEKDNEKEKDAEDDKPDDDDDDEDSDSDEDGMAITIGPLKKQTDVIQAPTTHPQKFQPKAAPTAGLKDEDFTTGGKVNGVPVAEFKMDDFEDKPWRKPGADLSDYFNYGFNEETWFKYCERQKKMRISESGAGLSGLGIGVGSNKPSYQTFSRLSRKDCEFDKYQTPPYYGGARVRTHARTHAKSTRKYAIILMEQGGTGLGKDASKVMTADRREYSNKIVGNQGGGGYDDNMDFGGNPYGNPYAPPPDPYGNPYGGGGGGFNDQGWSGGEWEHGGGPPGGMPPGPPPPILPPVSGPPMYFNNEDSMGAHSIGDHGGPGDLDRQRYIYSR
ncbi:unnamed protein product, partial [Meganyctiphanes norvegica]